MFHDSLFIFQLFVSLKVLSFTWLLCSFFLSRSVEQMAPSKQVEEASFSGLNQTMNEPNERDEEEKPNQSPLSFRSLLWHGGSVYDAWFSCASNQVLKLDNSQNSQNPQKPIILFCLFFFVDAKVLSFLVGFFATGCSGSVNSAILFFSTGNALRHHISSVLWHHWKLDCIFDQHSLCWISKSKGKRECQLQEPCHSG